MTVTGKVLVTGATGNIGSAVLDNLGTTNLGLRRERWNSDPH